MARCLLVQCNCRSYSTAIAVAPPQSRLAPPQSRHRFSIRTSYTTNSQSNMDVELRCNNLRCRATLQPQGNACVTSCSRRIHGDELSTCGNADLPPIHHTVHQLIHACHASTHSRISHIHMKTFFACSVPMTLSSVHSFALRASQCCRQRMLVIVHRVLMKSG